MPQTGATRYQKFLKSEKGKTKLKAKKDLPKGTNVTKTNFKVKKIVIKDQLKKHKADDLVSTRKLNVNDLLSRINHFNVHSRIDALNGLKELLTNYSEVIFKNFGQLIHGITPLALNIEKSVRIESLNVLNIMLSAALPENIEPFYDFLSTYLRSAMTHIDNRIQEDSLLLLDILMVTTGENIAKDFYRIIPNFLDMISKLRIDSKPGRTLTVNLKSEMTSVKWRVKVLCRLNKFLQIFVESKKHIGYIKGTNINQQVFDINSINYFPLFKESNISNCQLSLFLTCLNSSPLDEIEKFKSYIESLMTLLFETWLEICPTPSNDNKIESILTEEAATLLKIILNIICLIWDLIQMLQISHPSSDIMMSIRNMYRKPFRQHFVAGFPFVTNKKAGKLKANPKKSLLPEETISDLKLTEQNLSICCLFILLHPDDIRSKHQLQDLSSIVTYIEKTLNRYFGGSMMEVLNLIFCNENIIWRRNLILLKPLYKKIVSVYIHKTDSPDNVLFTLLCNIAMNTNLSLYHNSEEFTRWSEEAPKVLLQTSITKEAIDVLHKIATQNNKTFNNILGTQLLSIINNLPNILIIDGEDSNYFKLYSLLYWLKAWDEISLDSMQQQILENKYKPKYANYIIELLTIKSVGGVFEGKKTINS